MKTLKQWESPTTPSSFDEFVKPGEEIDEGMYWYFLEVLPPIFHRNGVFQVGEPYSHTAEGLPTYGTYQTMRDLDENGEVVDKYFYHGNLTTKQAIKI
jgi:hypothetical protein